jgi:hypothetical protein
MSLRFFLVHLSLMKSAIQHDRLQDKSANYDNDQNNVSMENNFINLMFNSIHACGCSPLLNLQVCWGGTQQHTVVIVTADICRSYTYLPCSLRQIIQPYFCELVVLHCIAKRRNMLSLGGVTNKGSCSHSSTETKQL